MGNQNVQKIKILFASLFVVIAAVADVYVIVNAPHNYVLLAVISLILLVAVYFVIDGKMQLKDYSDVRNEEKYDNLMTSQKACYIQVRKGFREANGKVNEIDKKITPLATAGEVNHQKISGLLNSLIEDQKKIAKLTVGRSKENANAIMNSNDKVLEEMLKLQEAVNNIAQEPGNGIQDSSLQEFSKVEEGQQELLSKIQQLEDSLKNQIENISNKFEGISEVKPEMLNIEELVPEESKLNMEELVPEESGLNIDELMPEEPELNMDELMPEEPELNMDELMPEESGLNVDELLSKEPEINFGTDIELESAAEETVLEEDPIAEEAVSENEPESDFGSKVLSSEDIAALITGSNEEILPETVEEPLEQTEEKIPMPDLSDPNKKMSPEDIAALIANM